jgi:hypothetical protein
MLLTEGGAGESDFGAGQGRVDSSMELGSTSSSRTDAPKKRNATKSYMSNYKLMLFSVFQISR